MCYKMLEARVYQRNYIYYLFKQKLIWLSILNMFMQNTCVC